MLDRVFTVVQAFIAGVIIALLGTVVHGEMFPLALLLGLGTVVCFLVAVRMLWQDRLATVSGAIAVVVTVFIFSQRSAGGSVLIQADIAGQAWVFGTAIIAGLAAAWPQISAASRD
ncbi:MAG: hypothetical protein ACKOWN_00290 [Microbacteriaceae bacterium]